MKHHIQIFSSSLLLLIVIASCNGQVKTNLPKDSLSEPKTITAGQPRNIISQGRDQNQNVQCGLQDRTGKLWFGTSGDGIYRYDGKLFTNFTVKDGLNSDTIWSLLEDKNGIIWIGTGNGICRYDGKIFTTISIDVTNDSYYLSENSHINAWPKNAVMSMIQDRTGEIWFGTGDGVFRYDGKSFIRFLHNDGVINNNGLYLKGAERILEDKDGNIWFGGRSHDAEGVCRYDGKSITNFKPNGEAWVRPLLQDRAGSIWFGSRNNMVYRYDGKTFNHFAEKEITGWVFNMTEDKSGNLWFSSSMNGGVTRYDPQKGEFKNFNTKDGFSNNSVWCIVKDNAGNLWFGTKNTGLFRYDGKTFKNFTENIAKK